MMTFLGNGLLAIGGLITFALISSVYGKMPRGDAAVSYLWGIIFINLAFWICMNLLCLIIAAKGGFDWISPSKATRYFLVYFCLFVICLTIALSGLFRHENSSSSLRFLGGFVPVLAPIVLLLIGAILLNNNFKAIVPLPVYRWSLIVVSSIGIFGVASGLLSLAIENTRNDNARIQEIKTQEDENHLRILREIDSCNAMVSFNPILVFTGDNQPPKIWHKAVAKVKENPNWQRELIKLLDTDWVAEAFQFLASNPVEDTALFIEPVRLGVLKQAELVRERIRQCSHTSHFYPEMFAWEIERVIRTIERFKGNGTDYVPAMKELRAALDEPSEYKKIKFICIEPLDKWIKVNTTD